MWTVLCVPKDNIRAFVLAAAPSGDSLVVWLQQPLRMGTLQSSLPRIGEPASLSENCNMQDTYWVRV